MQTTTRIIAANPWIHSKLNAMIIITLTQIFFQFIDCPEQVSNWYLQRGNRWNTIAQFTRERFLKQAIADPSRNKSADSSLKKQFFFYIFTNTVIFL